MAMTVNEIGIQRLLHNLTRLNGLKLLCGLREVHNSPKMFYLPGLKQYSIYFLGSPRIFYLLFFVF